ncbi:hypothetical protein RYX56_11815 [Alkalihalophilus lindianensis]|uniref:Uncharacterized protein n=1 Tax=Alkalihalophilus lindianensis TaxID=1630542 RepID=A0ABU3XAZ3_9BACI|nr:hypothetical protein [Alkalihalophilus lindianensis]MDV2685058.1 hypothetical protein [Alkalihalophilus lindianensis]
MNDILNKVKHFFYELVELLFLLEYEECKLTKEPPKNGSKLKANINSN